MQTVQPVGCIVARRQEEIREQVAMCRRGRAVPGRGAPRGPWRVRLGWRLVEIGLRLALPAGAARSRHAGVLLDGR